MVFIVQKSSLKWLFVGKYRTVVPRYLWYCGTTIVPWPRRYWYREKEVPRFHGSTMVPPNTSLKQLTRWCHLRSVPVNLPAPFEDILILLLLQHCLILLVLTLTIVVLVVSLLLRPLQKYHVMMMMMMCRRILTSPMRNLPHHQCHRQSLQHLIDQHIASRKSKLLKLLRAYLMCW